MRALLRHKLLIAMLAALLVIGGALSSLWTVWHTHSQTQAMKNWPCIHADLKPAVTDVNCIFLEEVSTPEALTKGLSGRDALDSNRGMLFTFAGSDVRCFWMKDMKFNIDIVWLDAQSKIIAKEINVSPDSYPQSLCPDRPAHSVIELNPGVSTNWMIGEKVPIVRPDQLQNAAPDSGR